ncbi:MAG: hypothetical protein RLZZ511_3587 [Cyanobacteriota bacterium]|jgi:glycosyltransferase involved in cell wall biosynthesis
MHVYLYSKFFPVAPAPIRDGIVKAMHGLAAGFVANDTTTTILSEGPQAATTRTDAGYVHHCFKTRYPGQSWHLSPDLQQFIQTHITDRDLVILNGGFHLSVYALARFLLQRGIPYIVAPHIAYDPPMFQKSPYLKYPYWHLLERRLLQHAAAIQVLDQRQAIHLQQRRIHTPIVAVPNGFDRHELMPCPPRTPDNRISDNRIPDNCIPDNCTIKLLFFGRLSLAIKGLDLLLQAFAQLPRSPDTPNLRLTLQGHDAGDLKSLQQLSHQLGLRDEVEFLPPDYHTPASTLMGNYDIICLPSRSEGFGLSALEAMLAGRPVMVSSVAGIAPYVEASGGGIVVSPDAQSIQAGLQFLFKSREQWSEMGQNGRQYAIDNLSWPTIAQTALAAYRELFNRPQDQTVIASH